jgi:hypothetical protein
MQQLQQKGGRNRCISPEVKGGEYDPSIALAAHYSPNASHLRRHVDFADWRPLHRHSETRRHVVQYPGCGQVCDHRTGGPAKDNVRGQSQGPVFANGASFV